MTPVVNTVLGPVEASALGQTLMHEHTTVMWPGAEITDRAQPREEAIDNVVAQLEKIKAARFDTVVDAAP
jgi:predicted metal-dependent phosphotriesterase family hydrolase